MPARTPPLLAQRHEKENARRRADDRTAPAPPPPADDVSQAVTAEREGEGAIPGPRARIEHILDRMEPTELISKLKAKAGTAEGLHLLGRLLPEDEFPAPAQATCLRCHKAYDPSYEAAGCRMRHPEAYVREEGGDSSLCTYQCGRCGTSWTCAYDVEADAGWCFEGAHEPKSMELLRDEGWFGHIRGWPTRDDETEVVEEEEGIDEEEYYEDDDED
jgi:hypothetical protein